MHNLGESILFSPVLVRVLVLVVVLETAWIKEVRTIEDHLDDKMSKLQVVGDARAMPTTKSQSISITISTARLSLSYI